MYATLELDNTPQLKVQSRRLDHRLAVPVIIAGLTLFGAATIASGVTPMPGGLGPHVIITKVR